MRYLFTIFFFLLTQLINGEELFKKFVDSVFTDIRKNNTKDLIIDLKNNPGGHNAYSDYLISYIANKPFKWYSDFSLKTSKLLKDHLLDDNDEILNELLKIIKLKNKEPLTICIAH